MSWAKFIARRDVLVDLSSTTDMDGNVIEAVELVDLNLPPQKIRKMYSGKYKYAYEIGQPEDSGYEYYQLDFELETLDEIDGKFTIPRLLVTELPSPIFQMEEDGVYTFDVKITLGHNRPIEPNFCQSTLGKYVTYIQINDETPIAFTGVDVVHGSDTVTEWSYNDILTLKRLDEVRIYVQDLYDFSTDVLYIFGEDGFEFSGAFPYGESYMNVEAYTTFPETAAQVYLLHDALGGVIERIVGRNAFYSEFFGSTSTIMRQYESDGCGWKNVITRGLQIRGYTFDEKRFSISFNQLWKCVNPLFCLGLGYDEIDGEQVIRIEPMDHFYDI